MIRWRSSYLVAVDILTYHLWFMCWIVEISIVFYLIPILLSKLLLSWTNNNNNYYNFDVNGVSNILDTGFYVYNGTYEEMPAVAQ